MQGQQYHQVHVEPENRDQLLPDPASLCGHNTFKSKKKTTKLNVVLQLRVQLTRGLSYKGLEPLRTYVEELD